MTDKLDTKAIRAQYSDGEYLDAYQGEACATILALCGEVDELRADNERLKRLLDLHGVGPAERYWEGRWRDEAAENDRLRAALMSIERIGIAHSDSFARQIKEAQDIARAALGQEGDV